MDDARYSNNSTSEFDIIGGLPQISCPINPYIYNVSSGESILINPHIDAGFANLNISITYVVHSAILFTLAILTVYKYGRIKLFGRKIPHKSVKMHLFAWTFATSAAYAAIEATRYALGLPYYIFIPESYVVPSPSNDSLGNNFDASFHLDTTLDLANAFIDSPPQLSDSYFRNVDAGLLLGSVVLRALCQFLLAVSLHWSYKYRTRGLTEETDGNVNGGQASQSTLSSKLFQRNEWFGSDTYSTAEDSTGDSVTSPLLPQEADSSEILRHFNGEYQRRDSNWWKDLFFEKYNGKYFFYYDRLFLSMFILHLVSLYLNITPLPHHWIFRLIYIISFVSLELPILFMTLQILISKTAASTSSTEHILQISSGQQNNVEEGPRLSAKFYLFLGMIFGICGLLPPSILTRFYLHLAHSPALINGINGVFTLFTATPQEDPSRYCFPLFHLPILSVIDFLNFAQVISMVFYFAFVRSEFKRVKAHVIWRTVSRISGVFGWNRNLAN